MDDIELTAKDRHRLAAAFALPEGKPRGGLVVIQDTYGIGGYIRSVCDWYAALGYACAAPALYDRQQRGADFPRTNEGMAASQILRGRVTWPDVLADVEAVRAHLSNYGKVGIVGFCFGGSVAWLAAQNLPFAAASSYYGRDVPHWLDQKPLCPTTCHFAESDPFIPLEGALKVRAQMPDIPVHIYAGAGHGFDNPDTGTSADTIALARARTVELFLIHVG